MRRPIMLMRRKFSFVARNAEKRRQPLSKDQQSKKSPRQNAEQGHELLTVEWASAFVSGVAAAGMPVTPSDNAADHGKNEGDGGHNVVRGKVGRRGAAVFTCQVQRLELTDPRDRRQQ